MEWGHFEARECALTAFRKSAFGGPSGAFIFFVDLPADTARLAALFVQASAYAQRVQSVTETVCKPAPLCTGRRRGQWLKMCGPGALFSGKSDEARPARFPLHRASNFGRATGRTDRLCLAPKRRRRVRFPGVAGRLDSGPNRLPELTLRTRNFDRIAGAGPMLGEPGDWPLPLPFRVAGTVFISHGNWTFRSLDSGAAAATKSELLEIVSAVLPGDEIGGDSSRNGHVK